MHLQALSISPTYKTSLTLTYHTPTNNITLYINTMRGRKPKAISILLNTTNGLPAPTCPVVG